jgi:hypothetical protein
VHIHQLVIELSSYSPENGATGNGDQRRCEVVTGYLEVDLAYLDFAFPIRPSALDWVEFRVAKNITTSPLSPSHAGVYCVNSGA